MSSHAHSFPQTKLLSQDLSDWKSVYLHLKLRLTIIPVLCLEENWTIHQIHPVSTGGRRHSRRPPLACQPIRVKRIHGEPITILCYTMPASHLSPQREQPHPAHFLRIALINQVWMLSTADTRTSLQSSDWWFVEWLHLSWLVLWPQSLQNTCNAKDLGD